jgi:metal-responsive CopG/Arc/MetJ family transcriptional regulator
MKKMIFNLSDRLTGEIDKAVDRWGFATRSEFFRYLAVEFLRHDNKLIGTDEVLKEHNKEIQRVRYAKITPNWDY